MLPVISATRSQFLPICRQCLRKESSRLASLGQAWPKETRQHMSRPAAQTQVYAYSKRPFAVKRFYSATKSLREAATSPLASMAESMPPSRLGQSASKRFPKKSSRIVGYWMLGSAGLVFAIIVVGGLTRLTESGLSITEWKPITGTLPPLSQSSWQSEFDKYRATPEATLLNPNMTLSEFRSIYLWEYSHRLLGRVIGLSFLLPGLYFIARRKVTKRMAVGILVISAGIGIQGGIGWWMVKSGLDADKFGPDGHPRVSQYRLAAHLSAALAVYVGMLASGLSILQSRRPHIDLDLASATMRNQVATSLRPLRRYALALTALTLLTSFSGAIVAGLDAGLVYNDFPFMNGQWTPPASELFDNRYSRDISQNDLYWRNALENPALAQLDHRILAMSTFIAICALAIYTRRLQKAGSLVPTDIRNSVRAAVVMAHMQVALGISTLWYLVPTSLAGLHQAGAVALVTTMVVASSRINAVAGRRAARTAANIMAKEVKRHSQAVKAM